MPENLSFLLPAIYLAAIGGGIGLLLAVASRIFAVKVDQREEAIKEVLPGANCGGCGYSGCASLARAIVAGEAKTSACTVGGAECAKKIAGIMGVEADTNVRRMRAQVMCSGGSSLAKKKYVYKGAPNCSAAARLGGGDMACPHGCIGLGTCATVCPVSAIKLKDGLASVDYKECIGCGACVTACPKGIIKLVPYESKLCVGCTSIEKGALVRSYCDMGCIGCKKCEKVCEFGAISVVDFAARIDYDKCTACGKCAEACPRHIIKSFL